MEVSPALLSSAVLLGFVGSGHCLGMCGGIAGALGQAADARVGGGPFGRALVYSAGRLSSYAALGLVAGALGDALGGGLGAGPFLRVLAGLLIVAFGFQTLGWGRPTQKLEELGLGVWRRLTPTIGRLGRPDRLWKLLCMGALWGFLPCGLVYSALAAASVSGSGASGGAYMLLFGLGTLPALVVAGGAAERIAHILRGRSARRAMGALLIGFGCWTIVSVLAPGHAGHGRPGEGSGHSEHGVHLEVGPSEETSLPPAARAAAPAQTADSAVGHTH